MHPPPPQHVFQTLRGWLIDSVTLGKHSAHLFVDESNSLSIFAPFKFGKRDAIVNSTAHEFPLESTEFTRLVGLQVVDSRCDRNGSLTLDFANGDRLLVCADDPMYEAYTLKVDGEEFFV